MMHLKTVRTPHHVENSISALPQIFICITVKTHHGPKNKGREEETGPAKGFRMS